MQTPTHSNLSNNISLGQRRGVPDLARFALDLTWVRAKSERAARLEAYPSPPMSGSPPPPHKPSHDAGDRGHGGYQPGSQDAYRGTAVTQGDNRMQAMASAPTARHFPPEPQERIQFPFSRPEEPIPRPMPYLPQAGQPPLQQHSFLPMPGTGPPQVGYAVTPRPPVPAAGPPPENPQYTSPKSQRKTKGHVASACVPCKRAHLRQVLRFQICGRLIQLINNRCDGMYWSI